MVRVVVNVPKELHGKVVGKGGATKEDIESDYGVKITMPNRNDETALGITIEGSADAVQYAEERIQDICGMRKNDAAGDVRDRLQALRREKDDLYRRAHAAAAGPERESLFNQANQAKQRLEQAEESAALEIFKSKNKGYGDEQMDLHGLSVKDAERFVNQRLDKVRSRLAANDGVFVLEIITGIGNHSEGNVAKIKPAIQELLSQRGFAHRMDETGGTIVVTGVGAGGAQPAPQKPSAAGQPAGPVEDPFVAFFEMVFDAFACCFGLVAKHNNKPK